MDNAWRLLYLGLIGLFGCILLSRAQSVTKNSQDSLSISDYCQPYEQWNAELNQCCPKCYPNCSNKARNKCNCGRVHAEVNGTCHSICKNKPCPEHGLCVGADSCICDLGYIWNRDNRSCQVTCEHRCDPNAACIAPNFCKCNKGYVSTEAGPCKPVCTPDCGEHSKCVEPEKCICDAGYEFDLELKCRPKCKPNCGSHAECIDANICQCKKGYAPVNGICQPVCTPDCGKHGHCYAPDKCVCVPGYEWQPKQLTCVPKCEPKCGLHSYCASINRCKCNEGYKPDNIHSLTCSMKFTWYVYVLIGLIILIVLSCIGGIIIYCVKNSRHVIYYPNVNFSDTERIVQ